MQDLGRGREFLALLLSQVSRDMHEAIVPTIFPSLGANISGAEFQYHDLSWKESCGMLTYPVAEIYLMQRLRHLGIFYGFSVRSTYEPEPTSMTVYPAFSCTLRMPLPVDGYTRKWLGMLTRASVPAGISKRHTRLSPSRCHSLLMSPEALW